MKHRPTSLMVTLALLFVAPAAAAGIRTEMGVGGRTGIGIGTIEEDPAVTQEKWKRRAEEDYKTGMEARAAGKKAQAVKFLLRAFRIGRRMRIDSPYPQKAADALAVLSKEGTRELDVARDLAAGEAPRAGLLELKRITRTYLGLRPAKQAGALLRQLQADPAFQARLRAVELAGQLGRAEALETRAAALLAEADLDDTRGETPPEGEKAGGTGLGPAADVSGEAHGAKTEATGHSDSTRSSVVPTESPWPKDADATDRTLTPAERRRRRLDLLAEAHALYVRLAEQGEGTDVGKKAGAARRRLEQDPRLMARIRRARLRDQAREWLGLATNYMRAGRIDKAREYFEKILAECPDTPPAREARGFLDGMTK